MSLHERYQTAGFRRKHHVGYKRTLSSQSLRGRKAWMPAKGLKVRVWVWRSSEDLLQPCGLHSLFLPRADQPRSLSSCPQQQNIIANKRRSALRAKSSALVARRHVRPTRWIETAPCGRCFFAPWVYLAWRILLGIFGKSAMMPCVTAPRLNQSGRRSGRTKADSALWWPSRKVELFTSRGARYVVCDGAVASIASPNRRGRRADGGGAPAQRWNP